MEKRRESEDLSLAFLLCDLLPFLSRSAVGFPEKACWRSQLGESNKWGKEKLEEICVIHRGWGQRAGEGHSRCSATELGVKRGELIWKKRGRSEDLQLAYLFPRPARLGCPDEFLLALEARIVNEWGMEDWRSAWSSRDGGQRGKGDHSRCSATELEMRLGIGVEGMEEEVEICSLPASLSEWPVCSHGMFDRVGGL